jgi:hypothetical protein
MNETTLAVPLLTVPLAPDYKNRSGGLVVFGVLTILLGVICGLMVPMMLLGQLTKPQSADVPAITLAMILPALLIYGGLAVAWVWLGIGSIKARRWARALLLIYRGLRSRCSLTPSYYLPPLQGFGLASREFVEFVSNLRASASPR